MIIYFGMVNGVYTASMPCDDEMTAFWRARAKQQETKQAVCVVENAGDAYNVFTVSAGGDEWVADRYAQEWKTENCRICDGRGKISDGYEDFRCPHCYIDE